MAPVELITEQFGTLAWDEAMGGYAGRADWCGRVVQLLLSCPDTGAPERALQAAASLFREQSAWAPRIIALAVDELLVLKNRNWLEEGEAELSRDAFLARMRLTGISIDGAGLFFFRHDDDDMFWGHDIVISGTLAQGPMHANLEG